MASPSKAFSLTLFVLFGSSSAQPLFFARRAPFNLFEPLNQYPLQNQNAAYPVNGVYQQNQNANYAFNALRDPSKQKVFDRRPMDYSQYYQHHSHNSNEKFQDVDTVSEYNVPMSSWLRDLYYFVVVKLGNVIMYLRNMITPITSLFSG
ncbi:hypothetical protein GE061_007521 [Apolygus lucorum]|uniref:Uncharacterized protein n=1 Tax=Apolygus lucorum TaxID=248454 RepID=A0A6A4IXX1_APOLU|nr:hypothetical protein GE061_007521 [Apolygus lucorum]